MGDSCSTCCTTNEDPVYNTMVQDVTNDRWIKAVKNNHVVGCRYVHMDDPDVIDQIVDVASGERAIHFAVRNHNAELVEYLGDNNVDIDSQSRIEKETALHIAAKQNDVPMIKLLLSLGSDPDIRNKTGKVARDLCNKTLRREFNKAKVDKLRRQRKRGESIQRGSIATGNNGSSSRRSLKTQESTNDIYIGGQSIHDVGLKKLRKLNANTDTETEAAKRARVKKEEIAKRGDRYLTPFGRKVGCEVDEMALFLEKLDKPQRKELWIKIMQRDLKTDKQIDVKKIASVLAYSVAKKKQQQRNQGKAVKSVQKPDLRQIERLVSVIRRQFPREKGKKILTRSDFINKMHLWLYEIHESDEWQSAAV